MSDTPYSNRELDAKFDGDQWESAQDHTRAGARLRVNRRIGLPRDRADARASFSRVATPKVP